MFFLIRVVFWLSVVFSSMAWTVDGRQLRPHALREAVLDGGAAAVEGAKDVVVAQARAWCVNRPDRCVADAARLTQLVMVSQTATDLGSDADPALAASVAIPVSYPLPVADPRHRVPSKGLTRVQ